MKFLTLVNEELSAMGTNLKEKNVSAEEFFKGQGIQPEKKLLDSDFSNSLREKVHSLYLDFTDQKMKWLLAKKKLLLFGGGFLAFVLVAASLVTLTVPSVRDRVSSTAANLFGRDKKQEENVDGPDKEEADTTAPELIVTAPDDRASTVDGKITVSGKTDLDARVFVGESEVDVIDGVFSKEIELTIGDNVITVKAKDGAGNETVKTLTVTRREAAEPTPNPVAKITLSGTAVDSGIKLTWNVTNVNTSNGFKILKGSSSNLTYPANGYYKYIENGSTRAYTAPITNGATYYFRICQYLDNGTCGVYSNSVKVTAPTKPEGTVSSISLTAGAGKVTWSVSGYSDLGFKVVWSKVSGPTYPLRDSDRYVYYTEPGQTSHIFGADAAFDGPGTYYVRVCEYLGGACGVYSNQEVTVTLD